VKLQAITLAAKLLVLSPSHATLTQLGKYVFALARYDRNYDVRDRGRMLQQLLAGVVPDIGAADTKEVGGVVLRRAQVRIVLFEGKESPSPAHAAHLDSRERLGTLGLVLGRDMPPAHARILPDWLEHGVESSLRDSPDDFVPPVGAAPTAIGHVAAAALRSGAGSGSSPIVVLTPAGSGGPSPAGSMPNRGGWKDLDKFYESDEEDDEDEEGEDEDEDGEGEGEEEEGTEGSDDEEEESEHQSGGDKDPGGSPPRTRTPEEDSDVDEGSSSRKALIR
jgi:AP-3 complex subunit beta